MSYATPVYIESSLKKAWEMGLLISTSSIAGLIFDFLVNRFVKSKPYKVYLLRAILLALLFPVILLTLPPTYLIFLLGMMVWGVYYELIRFSDFHFIHTYFGRNEHAKSWGILITFKSVAYAAGPLLASLLISRVFKIAFSTSIVFVSASLLAFLVFSKTHKVKLQDEPIKGQSLIKEYKAWLILLRKIWPLWLFIFSIFLVDATFWTIGTVLSEILKTRDAAAGRFLLTAYMLPSLFIGFAAQKASIRLGKKRTAIISGLASGLILALFGFCSNTYILLGLAFSASIFSGLAVPEVMAVFEDFVARLERFKDDVISLERTGENLAYILGPIVSGFLAQFYGFQKVFSIMGLFLAATSAVALCVTPRKVRLPQSELKST